MSLLYRGVRKLKRIARKKMASLGSPLRVGIIGCGQIASDHLWGFETTARARVVAASDILSTPLANVLDQWPSLRGYRDFRQMLAAERLDIVSVCTWPQSHADIVVAAAHAGVKAILCEKPLALTLDQLELMAAACQEHGVKLAVGHQYRFHPTFVQAASMIRSGQIGALTQVSGYISGSLANNGPHLIDTVRFLIGDRSAIQASCHCERTREEYNRNVPSETGAKGEIVFEGGLPFDLRTGDRASGFFSILVEGAKGSLRVSPHALELNGAVQGATGDLHARCRQRQFGEFVAWVKGKRPDYAANHREGVRSTELILSLYESAHRSMPVRFPLTHRGDVIHELYPSLHQSMESGALSIVTIPPPSPQGERLAIDGGTRTVRRWFSTAPKVGTPELMGLAQVVFSKNLGSTDGEVVRTFEAEFAAAYGARTAVASTSGTAAIHIALGALNPEPGDEVITTPITDMGSVIPILACNCVPVFADVDPVTGNMTEASIRRKITPRTRAVVLVHLFGRPANLDGIVAFLRGVGIPLIEDCSQAHFAEYQGNKVGTFGDFGCFSLQQSKQITCGDGGVTLVNRVDLADRAAMFGDKGWDRTHGTRNHLFLGMNYRMTELQGAVARVQLKRLPKLIQARRDSADRLSQSLREIEGVIIPEDPPGTLPAWWKFVFGFEEEELGLSTDQVAGALAGEGVRVVREYLPRPVFEYPVLKDRRTFGTSGYPLTAFGYKQPHISEFPGYQDFCRRMLLVSWSHHAQRAHSEAIAKSVQKVLRLLPHNTAASRADAIPVEA